MYNQASQDQLKEKLDYELWLLNFLSNTEEILGGETGISTVTLTNRQTGANVSISLPEVLGGGAARKIINSITPLTFTASYKIVDMIFEWILEENYSAGRITDRDSPARWPFLKKIDQIRNLQLEYPPLMQSEPYIKDYLFALYDKLLKFRHEIVHRNKFSVSSVGKLEITTTTNGQLHILELDPSELDAFVKIAVAVAKLFTGNLSFGSLVDRLLKYHLDRIHKLHGLHEFNQAKPHLVNVVLKVPIEDTLFPADLKFVRQKLAQIHPNADVLFNLEIIGLVDDKPTDRWKIPVEAVPEIDIIELPSVSFEMFRTSLPKGD